MSAPQHFFDVLNLALNQSRHLHYYPQDLMYLVRPRYIGTILIRGRPHHPSWSAWELPYAFVGNWPFKELCQPLFSQVAATVPVWSPPASPINSFSTHTDICPDLEGDGEAEVHEMSPIADADPRLGSPFPAPPRPSLVSPPSGVAIRVDPPDPHHSFPGADQSSTPKASRRVKRQRISDSPTRASSSKTPRSNQARIKHIQRRRVLSSAPPPSMGTRSKVKAREVVLEAPPSPPPVTTDEDKDKVQLPHPPIALSSRSTLRPLVRQKLVPILSHIYSHGLDIPTMPTDHSFRTPSAADLRQVEASYTLMDALPGAIHAGDLSRLGPIPQPLASCSSCAIMKADGKFPECEFFAWGMKCLPCRGRKVRCTYELTPAEAEKHFRAETALSDLSLANLRLSVNRMKKEAHRARELANIARRSSEDADRLAAEVQRLVFRIVTQLPPAHVSARFTSTDVLRTLLNREPSPQDLKDADPDVMELVLDAAEHYHSNRM